MRKQFSGNATLATITDALASDGTTFSTNTAIGYPTAGPFVVMLTRLSDGAQEKILVASRSDVTFTVEQRGYDGTVPAAFASGDQVRHVVDAQTIQEANNHSSSVLDLNSAPEGHWRELDSDSLSASAALTDFPEGNSVLLITSGASPSWGLETTGVATAGTVTTYRVAGPLFLRSWQQYRLHTGITYWRTALTETTWNPWRLVLTSQGGDVTGILNIKSPTPLISFNDTDIAYKWRIYADAGNFRIQNDEPGTFTREPISFNSTQALFDPGTSALPSISFRTDTDTGLIISGANSMGFINGGILIGESLTSGFRLKDGSVSVPSYSFLNEPDTGFYIIGQDDLGFSVGGVLQFRLRGATNSHVIYNGAFVPGTDNALLLGGPSNRWSTVYAGTGTIQTSDELTKSSIQTTSLGLDFIKKLKPVTYKFKEGRRPHEGLLAQEVRNTLDELGIEDFAGYIDPSVGAKKPAKPRKRKEESKEEFAERMKTYKQQVEQYESELKAPKGLRYSEFIGPIIRAVQELSSELTEVRKELEVLKNA